MTRRQEPDELTIVYGHAEAGQLTASVPVLPGTISCGSTLAEARRNVLDALGVMLSVEPEAIPAGAATERVTLTLGLEREHRRAIDR
jgi:predicted RNase H-like HicB family nuclease